MTTKYGIIADVGGTNARFSIADPGGYSESTIYQCADFDNFDDVLAQYMRDSGCAGKIDTASIAIAGPVMGDEFKMLNLPWAFSCKAVAAKLGLKELHLMNDFDAVARSIPHLKDADIRQIGNGKPLEKRAIGIIGPGTGLGVASLFWAGTHYISNPGEGGHVTMAAQTQREFDIMNVMHKKYRHISAERVCSGKGLENIYNAIRYYEQRDDLPQRTPAEISAAAMDGSCDVCKESLDFMIKCLGNVAGNLALTLGAYGGIYIAGGIINKLGDYFYQSKFREHFLDKGRLNEYLDPIPTFVVQHQYPAFVGLHADYMALHKEANLKE
jgi:glucokinase